VRELMIADKLGNQYIRLVAVFGAVATLLLAAQSLGIPIGLLNLVLVTILGVATILSFVILGPLPVFNHLPAPRPPLSLPAAHSNAALVPEEPRIHASRQRRESTVLFKN
jgi:hypothetical protein